MICVHRLWETELVCQRPDPHDSGHVYATGDVPDGKHDDEADDQ